MTKKAGGDPTRAMLETLGAVMPTILFDPERITDATADEINRIRVLYREEMMMVMPLPFERLQEMHVSAPPDQLKRYKLGLPILTSIVMREVHDKNPKYRPTDSAFVKKAKNALEVEIFRLTGRQAAVELQASSRRRNLTPSGALDRAKATIARAIWRGRNDPEDHRKKSRLEGLIDRGRRLAARFFGTQRAIDRWRDEGREVAGRVKAEGRTVLPVLEADNTERASGVSWNEEQAQIYSGAMGRWNASVQANRPINLDDGEKVTNAVEARMTAPALMKVAISGDFDPTTVHKNLLLERKKFEVGMLLGRLDRSCSINLSPEQATVLKRAIGTVRRERCETQADACDWLLVEAAAKSYPLEFWEPLLDRMLASGTSETVILKNRSQAEEN